MHARALRAATLCLGLAGPVCAADEPVAFPTLTQGQRVRFATSHAPLRTATVVRAEDDVLLVSIAGSKEVVRVPVVELQRLEVSAGRRSYASEGAVIGAIPGALLGGLAGVGLACYEDDDCAVVPFALLGAFAGGTLTGLVGAGVGALCHTEKWERVDAPQVQLQLGPASRRGGVAVGLKVSF